MNYNISFDIRAQWIPESFLLCIYITELNFNTSIRPTQCLDTLETSYTAELLPLVSSLILQYLITANILQL